MPVPPATTTIDRRDLPPIPEQERVIRIVYSEDSDAVGRVLPLDGTRYELGRSVRGDGSIGDARLSRTHLRFAIDPSLGAYAVEDLESRNGTFVGGKRLTGRTLLEPNMTVSAGDTILVVDEAPPAASFPHDPNAKEAADELVGLSFTASALRRSIDTIARTDGPVLLLGPTGTGKEVTASAIHKASRRAGPIVAVNCAAIPSELAESELFGHVKGAFSGADVERPGHFVDAHGGTLFLDEVGDLPPGLQPKLLRVLEERRVRPVGGSAARPVDVRIVSATQLDLDAVGFRQDLFARLGDWVLRLPALAERRADILALFEHFARAELAGRTPQYTSELAEALVLHDWPLNARGLRQLARKLATIAPNRPWDLSDLADELQRPLRVRAPLEQGNGPDRAALEAALAEAKGNVSAAAERLGRDRKSLYRWMRRWGIDPKSFR